jgi:hypothetical protein
VRGVVYTNKFPTFCVFCAWIYQKTHTQKHELFERIFQHRGNNKFCVRRCSFLWLYFILFLLGRCAMAATKIIFHFYLRHTANRPRALIFRYYFNKNLALALSVQ